jgi:hypothetical protein
MRNGGNVVFLLVSGLSSINSGCLFFQSMNSRAIGFYCQIWHDFGYTSSLQQTNRVRKLQICRFFEESSTLPRFYQNNTNNCRNNVQNDRHYFEVYINDNDGVYAYMYIIPINKVKRCVRLEMLYRMSGDIYYLRTLLLHKPSHGDKIISRILLYMVVVNH